MGITKIINLMIAFITAYLLFMLVRWLVLPNIRIFPYIYPEILWVSLYNVFLNLCTQVFGYILAFLLIMYVIWLFIKLFVPNFPIPMKSIMLRLPPIYQLNKAGIFGLFDTVRRILVSNDTLTRRFASAGTGVGNFLIKGSGFLGGTMRDWGVPVPTPYQQKPELKPIRRNKRTLITEEQEAAANDEVVQCVEENTYPIYPELNSFEKANVALKNSQATTVCRTKEIVAIGNAISQKL